MQPAAIRQRAKRERDKALADANAQLEQLRAQLLSRVPPAPASSAQPPHEHRAPSAPTPTPAASSAPLWETVPTEGPGPEAFAAPPRVPPASENEGKDGTPFVDGAAAAPSHCTEADATMIASAFVAVFNFGLGELLRKRPEAESELEKLGVDIKATVAKADILIYASARNLAYRYDVSMKYADHIVCAGALGVGVAGFVIKPAKGANDNTRARAAKDANPRERARDVTRDRSRPEPRDEDGDSDDETLRSDGTDEELRL